MTGHVLLIGPYGVVGSAVAERLGDPASDWRLTTASRRVVPVEVDGRATPDQHLTVDLLDGDRSRAALAGLDGVTHLVYAGYTERPTMAETTAPNLAMLRHTLDGLRAAGAPLRRVVLIGGGKSYGEHLGPYRTPAKETHPRLLGPIFYNDQEDLLAARAAVDGFDWTVLRPDAVLGFALDSPMNLLTCVAVFAALSREAGVPLRFPGSPAAWTALHQFTDADLLAAAVDWALTSPAAENEVFNVTNGDLFRWEQLWSDIAEVFDMPTAPPQPMSLREHMAGHEAAWNRLVERHRLRPVPYHRIASWGFADGIWNAGFDMVQSTIKIRQAGFGDCVDSHDSMVRQLTRLRERRYVP
ncbi:SDR family oxidoreductase [Plantactinospora sp. GCM10030261]|uniref:SDR family oxidoreductase n=1 Tax=Plantactinospora sp. GCM10030261 TaxID=3273420 RepID=UPI00361D7DDD